MSAARFPPCARQAAIGKALAFSQGAVSRELSRNKGAGLPLPAGAVPAGTGPAQTAQADTPSAARHRPLTTGGALEPGTDQLLVTGRTQGIPQPRMDLPDGLG